MKCRCFFLCWLVYGLLFRSELYAHTIVYAVLARFCTISQSDTFRCAHAGSNERALLPVAIYLRPSHAYTHTHSHPNTDTSAPTCAASVSIWPMPGFWRLCLCVCVCVYCICTSRRSGCRNCRWTEIRRSPSPPPLRNRRTVDLTRLLLLLLLLLAGWLRRLAHNILHPPIRTMCVAAKPGGMIRTAAAAVARMHGIIIMHRGSARARTIKRNRRDLLEVN